MSMPSIFFVGSEDLAKSFVLNHKLPSEDVFECSNMEPLKLSTLDAVMSGKVWVVDMIDAFPEISDPRREEQWVCRISGEFRDKLVNLDSKAIRKVSTDWGKSEEVKCDGKMALTLIEGVRRIAKRAVETGQGMYLYFCL